MISKIAQELAAARFVTHVGFATVKLVLAGGLALLMVTAALDNKVAEARVDCVFLRLEPSGDGTRTVMSCGSRELHTHQRSFAGWAWQNRERRFLCDAAKSGTILGCELAE